MLQILDVTNPSFRLPWEMKNLLETVHPSGGQDTCHDLWELLLGGKHDPHEAATRPHRGHRRSARLAPGPTGVTRQQPLSTNAPTSPQAPQGSPGSTMRSPPRDGDGATSTSDRAGAPNPRSGPPRKPSSMPEHPPRSQVKVSTSAHLHPNPHAQDVRLTGGTDHQAHQESHLAGWGPGG